MVGVALTEIPKSNGKEFGLGNANPSFEIGRKKNGKGFGTETQTLVLTQKIQIKEHRNTNSYTEAGSPNWP